MESAHGPDPERVNSLVDLGEQLSLLRIRAAKGTARPQVSVEEITRRLNLPRTTRSTIHNYVTGRTLVPEDVLDQVVTALGATSEERLLWRRAWHRTSNSVLSSRNRVVATRIVNLHGAEAVTTLLYQRLARMADRRIDCVGASAQNVDLVHQVPRISVDFEAQVAEPFQYPGGSGSNTLLALARLGLRTSIVGAVANDADGKLLRVDLESNAVDTSYLLTIEGAGATGQTLVFSDGDGHRLIYVKPGVNEQLSIALAQRRPGLAMQDFIQSCRVLHLSSFTGIAERRMQENWLKIADRDTIVSLTPGSIYAAVGADHLGALMLRANVIFVYEQQLDELLARSSAGRPRADAALADKVRRLFVWRKNRGSSEPLIIAVKRPSDLSRGGSGRYLSVGFGREELEELRGPDLDSRPNNVLDSTGAGDALAGGLLFGLLTQRSVDECINLAQLMALSASTGLGARTSLPTGEDLLSRWRMHLPNVPAPSWLLPG